MTNIYYYAPVTLEYIEWGTAPIDPQTGEPMIPPNATTDYPEGPNGEDLGPSEVFVRDLNGGWAIVADNRGVRYWTPSGGLQQMEGLGDLPSDATPIGIAEADPDLVYVDGAWRLRSSLTVRQRARPLQLRALSFYQALAVTLGIAFDAIEAHIVSSIDAAETAGALTAADAQAARGKVRWAQVYHREDTAENKALLEALAVIIGLAPNTTAAEGILDSLFIANQGG